MMAYPDICEKYCRNFGRDGCPTSSVCMATTGKPYFKPKYYGHFSAEDVSWIDRWLWKREKRKICKANRYNCSECIYHEHLFEGARFCGTKCRLEGKR